MVPVSITVFAPTALRDRSTRIFPLIIRERRTEIRRTNEWQRIDFSAKKRRLAEEPSVV